MNGLWSVGHSVLVLGGVVLWWRRQRGRVRRMVRPELSAGVGVRRTRSWHASTGLWVAIVLLILSVTGLTWSTYAGARFDLVQEQLNSAGVRPDTTLGGGDSSGAGHEGHDVGDGTAAVDMSDVDTVLAAARERGLDGPVEITPAAGEAWTPEHADVIVVPGGGYGRRQGPGIWAEINRGTLPAALAAARRRGLTLASLCTGTLLLGAAGLLRNRPCTTHHGAVTDLEAMGGILKNARVVDDGDIVTAGGITSGLELALWLVKRELNAETAVDVENMLEYQARGTVWTR